MKNQHHATLGRTARPNDVHRPFFEIARYLLARTYLSPGKALAVSDQNMRAIDPYICFRIMHAECLLKLIGTSKFTATATKVVIHFDCWRDSRYCLGLLFLMV